MSGPAVLLLVHAGMSVIEAFALASAVRAPDRFRLVPFFLWLCVGIPVLGPAGLWAGVVLPLRKTRQAKLRRAPTLTVLPSLPADAPDLDRPVDAGPVRAIVAQGRDPERRLRALTGTRRWDDRAAVPPLLAALKDPVDDIRLLSYGLLDGRMQRAMHRIESVEALRENSRGDDRATLDRQVAFETWEVVRAGLLRGAAADEALREALRWTDLALSSRRKDSALQFLRGRLLLRSRRGEAAEALHAAVRHGMPARLVTPYLAEEAFHRRAFGEVTGILAARTKSPDEPNVRALRAFWLRAPEPELRVVIPLRADSCQGSA